MEWHFCCIFCVHNMHTVKSERLSATPERLLKLPLQGSEGGNPILSNSLSKKEARWETTAILETSGVNDAPPGRLSSLPGRRFVDISRAWQDPILLNVELHSRERENSEDHPCPL
jgi:hypothetical protein